MLKITIALCFIFLSSNNVYADNKIKGAFGIKFGQKFEISSAKGKADIGYDKLSYEFMPKDSFSSFTDYYVSITPLTHRVYSIYATADGYKQDECKKEKDIVASLIKDKYLIKKVHENFVKDKTLKKNGVSISIYCRIVSDDRGKSLNITYFDNETSKLVDVEKKQIKDKKKAERNKSIENSKKRYDSKGL